MVKLRLLLDRRRSLVDDLISRGSLVGLWKASEYDGSQLLTDLSGRGHHLQLGSTAGADSNDPRYLSYDGQRYIYLPGVTAGNYLSVPDEPALDIVGDIDMRAVPALDGWIPPATSAAVVAKGSSATTVAYMLHVRAPDGLLRTTTSPDGTNANRIFSASTVPPTVSDGEILAIRATIDVDNGAGGHTVTFYTKATTEGSAHADCISDADWVQLGAPVVNAGTTVLFPSSAIVQVGENQGGSPIIGKVYAACVKDGINGATVLDIDTSVASPESSTFQAVTGQTVTVNRSATGRKAVVVDRDLLLLGTDDFLQHADHADFDIDADDPFTIAAVFRQYGNAGGQAVLAHKLNLTGVGAGWYLSTNRLSISDGAATNQGNSVLTTAGVTTNVTGVITATSYARYFNGAPVDGPTARTVGSPSFAGLLRVGANSNSGTPANFGEFEFMTAAVIREALTNDEVFQLYRELAA